MTELKEQFSVLSAKADKIDVDVKAVKHALASLRAGIMATLDSLDKLESDMGLPRGSA